MAATIDELAGTFLLLAGVRDAIRPGHAKAESDLSVDDRRALYSLLADKQARVVRLMIEALGGRPAGPTADRLEYFAFQCGDVRRFADAADVIDHLAGAMRGLAAAGEVDELAAAVRRLGPGGVVRRVHPNHGYAVMALAAGTVPDDA